MPRSKLVWSVIIVLLVVGNIFFISRCYIGTRLINEGKKVEARVASNGPILDFTKLFIEKVLQSDREVDFETRLMLENKVRELNRKEILDQWNRFTKSQTEAEAQGEVKKLLLLLVEEAKVK